MSGFFNIASAAHSFSSNQYYLIIQFRHKHFARDRLIFVADNSKAYQENETRLLGWSINETDAWQDVIYDNDLSGLIDIPENQAYSVFTKKATMYRKDSLRSIRYVLPLLFLFTLIFLFTSSPLPMH
ncbi:MAG: hypothetical protein OMM_09269 [Candidatus Magnetoglobus multicellularis str. Araruama]|uniref:Uncharacterized protein n=1 Tax=Candidatus Magnetoglobus multicellularis str. Araruama TaxID=890399 RepID=A0A1V1P4S2_9BACT|nr:MAG: hypothetical protein OMM_09269 [Candidatus Magnetoglobus multicellularis str. Araruama]